MKKPTSKRDDFIKELRRVADYANALASGGKDNGDIKEAVSMLGVPCGDTYDSIHGELIAKGKTDQANVLASFHAKTIKAHQDFLALDFHALSYWVAPNGRPVDAKAVPVRKGKIGGRGYKVVTDIGEDSKRGCSELAKAASDEADYLSSISELEGTAEDVFYGLYEGSLDSGYSCKESFGYAVEKARADKRLSGMYKRFKNSTYSAFHMAYKRWLKKRPS